MKLKTLTIPNYKGFVDFKTSFDLDSPITTIIGQNGVGKSNLIEIIVSIFRSIDLGEKAGFSYELEYECRGHHIKVRLDTDNKENNTVNIGDQAKSFAFLKKNANEYLPLNIFTYYSGTNWRVEQLFVKHQVQFYKALTQGDDQLLRRFFYCRPEHSFFVLLAFLVDQDPTCKDILDQLGIESLDSVLFCLKKPYWFKNKPNEIMKEDGDPRFWYSRGVVRDFLDNLWEKAVAPIDNKERKTVDFRGRSEIQERLYLFLPDKQSLEQLNASYPSTTTLFKNLESTYIADLLENVDVTVNLKSGGQITFDQLSEGERQLLTVLGLMRFTNDDESLFLLDEPDTYLNPRWKLDYFEQIEKVLKYAGEESKTNSWGSSQVILTTHDPMMLTSLHKNQVRVLTQDGLNKSSEIPTEDPINMGVEAIIQSDLYGIRTSLDKEVQRKIDRRNRLLASGNDDNVIQEKISDLNHELDEMGLSHAHPNPYFSNFAKALSRNPHFRRPEFTPKEYDELQKLTDELLAEILLEEKVT